MKIRTFLRRKPWMTKPEWRVALRVRRTCEKEVLARGVPVTMALLLLLDDAITARLLAQRTEEALLPRDDGAPAPLTVDALQAITMARAFQRDAFADLDAHLDAHAGEATPESTHGLREGKSNITANPAPLARPVTEPLRTELPRKEEALTEEARTLMAGHPPLPATGALADLLPTSPQSPRRAKGCADRRAPLPRRGKHTRALLAA